MAGLVVLMWNIKCIIFCSMIVPCLNAFALSGRVNIICCGITQGVASLALGYVLLPFQGALSAAAQQFKQA